MAALNRREAPDDCEVWASEGPEGRRSVEGTLVEAAGRTCFPGWTATGVPGLTIGAVPGGDWVRLCCKFELQCGPSPNGPASTACRASVNRRENPDLVARSAVESLHAHRFEACYDGRRIVASIRFV